MGALRQKPCLALILPGLRPAEDSASPERLDEWAGQQIVAAAQCPTSESSSPLGTGDQLAFCRFCPPQQYGPSGRLITSSHRSHGIHGHPLRLW